MELPVIQWVIPQLVPSPGGLSFLVVAGGINISVKALRLYSSISDPKGVEVGNQMSPPTLWPLHASEFGVTLWPLHAMPPTCLAAPSGLLNLALLPPASLTEALPLLHVPALSQLAGNRHSQRCQDDESVHRRLKTSAAPICTRKQIVRELRHMMMMMMMMMVVMMMMMMMMIKTPATQLPCAPLSREATLSYFVAFGSAVGQQTTSETAVLAVPGGCEGQ